MRSLLLRGIKLIAGFVVVWCTFSNFLNLSMGFGGQRSREDGEVETYERLFLRLRYALFEEGYDGKRDRDLGFVTVRSVIGQPRDMRDDLRWTQLRYVVIPFILTPDPQGAPYVIFDYTGGDPIPKSLDGFVKIREDHGLILYKKVAP